MEDIPLSVLIPIQILFIALNAFLSVLEASIQSLSDGRVRKLAEEGDKDAIDMLSIENIYTKLSVSVTFACWVINILSGVFVVYPIAQRVARFFVSLGDVSGFAGGLIYVLAVLIVALLIVFISLIFGNIVPKKVFFNINSGKSVKSGQNSAKVLYTAFKPVIFLLIKLSDAVSKLFGAASQGTHSDITEDEIMMMVDAGEEKGTIMSNEKEMIENVFNFSTTTASGVMTHRTNVTALWIDDSKEDIIKTISQSGKSRFPVYDEDIDHIVGILIARDYLLNSCEENPKPFRELLRPAYLVPETIRTDILFKDMQRNNTHMAVVVDEYGGTSGIVTMEDLLEELVGNIYDESDSPAEQNSIQKLSENVWRVAGDVDLETLSSELMITFPEDVDYDTVGGLVFSCLSSIPPDGSHPEVTVNGLYIYVEELKNRRIIMTRISLIMGVEPPKEAPEQNDD